ncbi:hypothetical protein DK389_05565 [Methylobacterium durans]|uniref:Uncharacterized protein n=2 Tax=Methylobacterium durans TaxID=2202825 RepID=A0A2U8W413_9HYPH|nr:hypothetical protein DK389_05565 [Methylobacterium durans]
MHRYGERGGRTDMGRDEQIAAAKVCALAVLDEGKPNKAVSTFIVELRKHPAMALIITADKQAIGLEAAFLGPYYVRAWINSF